MGKSLDDKKELGRGISQRSDGLYMGRVMIDGKSETIYNRDLKQLKRDLTDLRSKMQNDMYDRKIKTTLCNWYDEWKELYGVKQRRKSTITVYDSIWKSRIASTKLAKKAVCDIKPKHIQELLNELVDDYSQSSIHVTFAILRVLLDQAYRLEMISRKVCDFVYEPKSNLETKHRVALTQEQQKIFIEMVQDSYLKTFYLTALYSGLRRGELMALQWRDIDFENGFISIERTLHEDEGGTYYLDVPKTEKSRRLVPIIPQLESVLREQKYYYNNIQNIRSMGENTDFVFTLGDNKPLTCRRIQWELDSIGDFIKEQEIDYPDLVCHVLRHTYCSNMARGGMNPKVLQTIMGHSNIAITMETYTHIEEDLKKTEALKAAASM